MKKIEEIKINPLLITFIVVVLFYTISAISFPFDSLTTLVIFILISLMSFSLANIIFSFAPGPMSASERLITVLHSSIIFSLTIMSVMLSMQKPMFSIEVVMSFLIISFFIIGGTYLVLGSINNGFPKWFRLSNFILSLITIILSIIALLFPLLGFLLLAIILSSIMIIAKALNVRT